MFEVFGSCIRRLCGSLWLISLLLSPPAALVVFSFLTYALPSQSLLSFAIFFPLFPLSFGNSINYPVVRFSFFKKIQFDSLKRFVSKSAPPRFTMLWPSLSLLSFGASLASSFVLPARNTQEPSSTTFSLDVARSETGKRDFQREWAAVRQKWGGSASKSGPSAFSLADDGTSQVNAYKKVRADNVQMDSSTFTPWETMICTWPTSRLATRRRLSRWRWIPALLMCTYGLIGFMMIFLTQNRWVQSTDTTYRVNRNGPWAPQYHPKDSHTSSLLNESSWDVQYRE